jgi:hypothetical protein
MENFSADQKLHVSEYLKESDPLYPCLEQEKSQKENCYLYAPTYFLSLNREDYAGALELCNGAEESLQRTCARGVGAQTMKENINDPKLVESACQSGAPEQVEPCINGLASMCTAHHGALQSPRFGPRVLTSAAGEQVFGRAVAGKSAQVAGDPDQPHTYTYAPDIGKGLVILGEHEEALGRPWHLPSPETVTTRAFVRLVFEEVGGEPKMQRAPKPLLWALGLFNPALRETIEMLYEFEEPFVVDHSALTRAFGDHATPLGEAIGHTVRWYRDERSSGE